MPRTFRQTIALALRGEEPLPDGWEVEARPAEPAPPAVEPAITSSGLDDQRPPSGWEVGPGEGPSALPQPLAIEPDAETSEGALSPGTPHADWQTPVVPADVPRPRAATTESDASEVGAAELLPALAAAEPPAPGRSAARTHSAAARRRRPRWWILGAVIATLGVVAAVVGLSGVLGDDAPETSVFTDRFDGAEHWIEDGTTPIWDQQAGSWTVAGGAVRVTGGTEALSLATIDRNVTDGIITVSMSTTNLAGLAFRVRDAENLWMLTSAATFGTWNLYQVREGRNLFITNIGPTPLGDIDVSVELDGRTITVLVNDQIALGLDDGYLADEDDAGLVVGRGEATRSAAFEAFSATVVLAE